MVWTWWPWCLCNVSNFVVTIVWFGNGNFTGESKMLSEIWFINGVDNVNWPPYRDWKADVSSISPSSERRANNLTNLCHLLWRRANAWNVRFSISVQWSIYIINSVDKPNFCVSLSHRRSTTVSSETNPFYSKGFCNYYSLISGGRVFCLIITISKFSNLIGHQQAWFQP